MAVPSAKTTSPSAQTTSAPSKNASGNLFASMQNACSTYTQKHRHAVCYGIIGFAAAALVLVVGFWQTLLLALFAIAGVFIGRYQDGDRKAISAVRALIGRMQ